MLNKVDTALPEFHWGIRRYTKAWGRVRNIERNETRIWKENRGGIRNRIGSGCRTDDERDMTQKRRARNWEDSDNMKGWTAGRVI